MDHHAAALLTAFELHDVDAITAAFAAGADPKAPIDGKPIMRWLTSMYTRSDRFPACVAALLAAGVEPEDPALLPVLLDDATELAAALQRDPALLHYRTTMVSTFTPLDGATLLHVAAEFGHVAACRTLLAAGADVDARAAIDAHGLGGQSPLFHTVNSNRNRSAPVMRLLLAAGADPLLRVQGLAWGRGFEWETTWFDLSPLSYAQLGPMPQMHRDERHITANVGELLRAAGRPVPPLANVPNRYVARG